VFGKDRSLALGDFWSRLRSEAAGRHNFKADMIRLALFAVLPLALCNMEVEGQTAAKPAVRPAPAISVSQAVELAAAGHCGEAMPVLKNALGHISDPELKRRAGIAGVRCAMSRNQSQDVTRFIEWLRVEFPHDPEILYLTAHAYSDLSIRASQELLFTNPSAPQVHEMNAEALETQGNWKAALSEYKVVLEQNPNMRGIHFRIGRLILSQPQAPTTLDDAKKEFAAELVIDPDNAAAEYVLGEIARQREEWVDAISHFQKATKLDSSFADAFVGLGRSLMANGSLAESIPVLLRAAELEPANPTTHYYAAMALGKAGRKPESAVEFAKYKEASDKAQKQKDEINLGVLGPQQVEIKKDQ
jgi:tetratricopeptide (TPR) repeat protein